MKLSIRPQGLKERIALGLNLAPVPIVHAHLFAHCARAVAEAVELGVLEAIGHDERTCEEIASRTGLHPGALQSLLGLLVSLGYLGYQAPKYRATPLTTKWLLRDSATSIADAIRFFRSRWAIHEHLPHYLRTGEGFQGQSDLPRSEWPLYQLAMLQLSRMGIEEVAKKTPLRRGATAMLDVGGSHGLYSVAFCKREPGLRSIVLDLPPAVDAAAPLLAAMNAEGRVGHRAGDILVDEIGESQYDLVFMSNLVHLFSAEQNVLIATKAARALKPGGHFVIQDFVRPQIGENSDTLSTVQNLFFAMGSASGTHSLAEQQEWQRRAGLSPRKVLRFVTSPLVQVVAVK